MHTSTKMQLRLPQEVKGWLKDEAARNDRSMNNQVVAVLREKMKDCSAAEHRETAGSEAMG